MFGSILRMLFVVWVVLIVTLVTAQDKGLEENRIETLIQHADTYLWLGLFENYNIKAFQRGLFYLDRAQEALTENLTVAPDLKMAFQQRISSLHRDLHQQIAIATGTFYGLFPLARMIGPSIFMDVTTNRTFEIADDVPEVASANAITRLAETLSQELTVQPQFDLFLRSFPNDEARENEAYFVLRDQFKLNLHFYQDWMLLLTNEERQQVFGINKPIPAPIIEKLCHQLRRQQILFITIEKIDVVDKIHYYRAIGQVYQLGKEYPIYTVTSRGFSRDSHAQILPILLTHLIYLLIGLATILMIQGGYNRHPLTTRGHDLLIGSLFFLVGRVFPWGLIYTSDTFRPAVDTPPLYAFWWAGFLGLLLLIVPSVLYWLIFASRLHGSLKLKMSSQGAVVCMMLALGGCSYLISPTFLYLEDQAWEILTPLVLIALSIGYLLGRALDSKEVPVLMAGIPPLIAIPFGIAYIYAAPLFLWGLVVPSLISSGIALWLFKRLEKPRFMGAKTVASEREMEDGIQNVVQDEFRPSDICDMIGLIERLVKREDPVSQYLFDQLENQDQNELSDYYQTTSNPELKVPSLDFQRVIANMLNQGLEDENLYTERRFGNLSLSSTARELIQKASTDSDYRARNKQLFLTVYQSELDDPAAKPTPQSVANLKEHCVKPSYIYSRNYYQALQILRPVLSGQSTSLIITGDSGMGKTAMVTALLRTLEKQADLKDQDLEILKAECPQPHAVDQESSGRPFFPFQRVLADVFGIDLFSSAAGQLQQIDDFLGGLFESVIPFAGLLFPADEENSSSVDSNIELFASIEQLFRQQVTTKSKNAEKSIILFIDNFQWIDQDSRDLVKYLGRTFRMESAPFSIILAGRNSKQISDIAEEMTVFDLGKDNADEEVQEEHICIMTDALNLKPAVAKRISEQIGDIKNCQGALYCLLQQISKLSDDNAFLKKDQVFTWSAEYRKYEDLQMRLPVSTEMETSVGESLDQIPEHQYLLEYAACLGMRFHAQILVECLGVSRLDVLRQLSEVERKTGIVHDLRESENLFAFQSPVVLKVVRQKSGIDLKGPLTQGVPQVIREYHGQIAEALERVFPNDPFPIAEHFYGADIARAEKATAYCLKAARTAIQQAAIKEAQKYIERARECAESVGLAHNNQDFIILECNLAHMSGEKRAEVANKSLNYLDAHPDSPLSLMIVVARACYDAGTDQRDQHFFAESVRIGEMIANRPDATPIEKAEGLHFIGIGTPLLESEKRKKSLHHAFNMLSDYDEHNIPAQALLARVANSLAQELQSKDSIQAQSLYERSIQVKIRPELRDINGLAISHNGLGRIALFAQPMDLVEAKRHFQESLKYAKQMGSSMDMSKSHSFLGECAQKESDYQQAVRHYRQSYQLATTSIDKGFAGAGLLQSLSAQEDLSALDMFGQALMVELETSGEIPSPCRQQMEDALNSCRQLTQSEWLSKLEQLMSTVE